MRIAIINCDIDENPATNGGTILHNLIPGSTVINYVNGEVADTNSFDCFIITGSRAHITDEYSWISNVVLLVHEITNVDKPCLGICFGMDVVANEFGGEVIIEGICEYGFKQINLRGELFQGMQSQELLYEAHKDYILKCPLGSVIIAENSTCIQGFIYNNFYCTQFHPEIEYSIAKEMAKRDGDDLREILAGVNEGHNVGRRIITNFLEIVRKK